MPRARPHKRASRRSPMGRGRLWNCCRTSTASISNDWPMGPLEGCDQLRTGSEHSSAKKRERSAATKERARDSSNDTARKDGQLEIESRLLNRRKTALDHIDLIRAQSREQ